MMRRKSTSVIAKVSQAESKSDSKQEGQPSPDDNVYVLVNPFSKQPSFNFWLPAIPSNPFK